MPHHSREAALEVARGGLIVNSGHFSNLNVLFCHTLSYNVSLVPGTSLPLNTTPFMFLPFLRLLLPSLLLLLLIISALLLFLAVLLHSVYFAGKHHPYVTFTITDMLRLHDLFLQFASLP